MQIRTLLYPFTLLLLTIWVLSSHAQPSDLECGTAPVKSEWLKAYQKNPAKFKLRGQDQLNIPLTIHILGDDEGEGYYEERKVLSDVCKLNHDFEQANIQFYINEINYINNTDWFDHESFGAGKQMMAWNNEPGTVNCYIVANPAGNCGYYSHSRDAVALKKGCLGSYSSTFAHELGHFFSLPHTFLGWESTDYDPDEPTPETIGNNNRAVENVDGSNCGFAGDGFCDTGPDYLSYRWSCNNNGESSVVQYDPNDEQFRSDGAYFMSYSSGVQCRDAFSQEQVDAMRANIVFERPGLHDSNIGDDLSQTLVSELIYPIEDTIVQYDDFTLKWAEIEGAEYYRVLISRFQTMIAAKEWVISSDTFLQVVDEGITEESGYYWKVIPFSLKNTCIDDAMTGHFFTDDMTATDDPSGGDRWNIYPNPTSSRLTVQIGKQYADGWLQLHDLNGRILQGWPIESRSKKTLYLEDIPPGIYFLMLQSPEGVLTEKIILE